MVAKKAFIPKKKKALVDAGPQGCHLEKVFQHGNGQTVRLPREFRVEEDAMFIRKSGAGIILTPRASPKWQNVRTAIAMFRGRVVRRQPAEFDARDRPA